MEVKACIFTDAGRMMRVNQDSAMIKVANTKKHGRISFMAVCDGFGDSSKGQIASCKVIRALENWFCEELVLMQDLSGEELWKNIEISIRRLIAGCAIDLARYKKHKGASMGTTLTALLQIGSRYMTVNIGDSRIYSIARNKVILLTGGSQKGDIRDDAPVIEMGSISSNTTLVACSDGLWRTVEEAELFQKLCPQMCVTAQDMLSESRKLADMAVSRDEEDDISVAAMCLEF